MRAVILVMLLAGTAGATPFVDFTGNDSIPYDELRHAIDSPSSQEVLERDLLLVSAYYWDRGYANVRVGEPIMGDDKITIPIEEGPKFTIGAVTVAPELRDLVRIQPGEVFSRTRIAEDRETLATFVEDQGYADASVIPFTSVDLDRLTIGLRFEITLGKRMRFGTFTIYGAPIDPIRRIVEIAEGERFNNTRLLDARTRLRARYGDVVISTRHGKAPDLVDVVIEIPESR